MLTLVDKKTLFQDRYQALIVPVPTSGIFRHRSLLRFQWLYREHYQLYRQACDRAELALGGILSSQTHRDLAGLGVGGALSKPKFIVNMAVTPFAENPPHLDYILLALQQLEPMLYHWGRYGGIRRVALLASDELIVPVGLSFEADILPRLQQYLQPVSSLNVVVYR